MDNNKTALISRRQALKLLASGISLPLLPESLQAAIRISSAGSKFDKSENHIKDYLYRINNFDQTSYLDYSLDDSGIRILNSVTTRLKRIQNLAGYANFSVFSIDDAVKIASDYISVGKFPSHELVFLEMLFYKNSSVYGFLGEKPFNNFTDRIDKKSIVKVKGSGQYLYRGESFNKFKIIKKTIGDELILTSGIRGVAKQFYLFLNKAVKSEGNLSKASRSLAPPGYSLHGTGDFDVGQKRFGIANFSIKFTGTTVYKKLIKSGFSDFRYKQDNRLGVRFEPWHIKV